ncbi:hypothetical protein Hypma_005992 [Hypsizygus marmoreus]|uniref:Uncharacterized protein n=1 Tax=Hypsizygus marmoreus TaxID=39966 RepID=A0A369K7Z6_HYPMA|nr:hypothetical protein Hypma_005992 [Hypsizygus marmoreus]
MPTLSEHQSLIRDILLATEEETRLYFSNLEDENDLTDDDYLDKTAEPHDQSESSSSFFFLLRLFL